MFLGEFPERVLIPPQVQMECCETKDTFDAKLIARLIKERHIVVRKLKNPGVAAEIRKEFNLGRGEAEAIALAQSTMATLILIRRQKRNERLQDFEAAVYRRAGHPCPNA